MGSVWDLARDLGHTFYRRRFVAYRLTDTCFVEYRLTDTCFGFATVMANVVFGNYYYSRFGESFGTVKVRGFGCYYSPDSGTEIGHEYAD